jgi:hypothetical protein
MTLREEFERTKAEALAAFAAAATPADVEAARVAYLGRSGISPRRHPRTSACSARCSTR